MSACFLKLLVIIIFCFISVQSGIGKVLELIIVPRIKPTVEVFSAMSRVLSEVSTACIL